MFKKNSDREIINSQLPALTFEQRIEIMLWGDEQLGVMGLKGRVEKNLKLIVYLFVLNTVIGWVLIDLVTTHDATGTGTINTLILKIFAMLAGG